MPYLPDPLAAGVVFRNVPRLDDRYQGAEKVDKTTLKIPFPYNPAWPEVKSFRLHLIERKSQMAGCTENYPEDPGLTSWNTDKDERELTVHLAKGEKVSLRYNSYLPGKDPIWVIKLKETAFWR